MSKTLRQKLALIFSIFMICFVLFGFGSCGDEEDADSMPFSYGAESGMYGTKVLYRPDNYDYNIGSGGTPSQENDYYGKYAYKILQDIYFLYGITNEEVAKSEVFSIYKTLKFNDQDISNIPYLYDSIRYQVNVAGMVTQEQRDGTTVELGDNSYYLVGADTSKKWKWSFNSDSVQLPLTYTTSPSTNMIYLLPNTCNQYEAYISYINDSNLYYDSTIYQKNYESIFLSKSNEADKETDYSNYSDFVKTLEYVIYSYALDIEPQMVAVSTTSQPYKVQIGAYSSVDEALKDIKALFKQIGSFVGLTQRQITKVSNWIKKNVIGESLINDPDRFYIDNEITAVYDGDNIVSFDINYNGAQELGRNYDETIDAIVKAVCRDVTIGQNSDGSGVTVDDRFLASEVIEYIGDTFFVMEDNFFQLESKINTLFGQRYINPYEYQSAVLMLSQAINISEMGVIFKYDADLDGTTPGVYDTSKYIDIIAELHYYSNAANKLFTIGSEKTRVYDGPFEFGTSSDDYPGIPGDHGMVSFNFAECEELKSLLVDGAITVGAFKPDIGGGVLRTDLDYNQGLISKSRNPLVLVGTTDVRKYYSIIEPTDAELGNANLTYSTGRLNEKMFAGSEGCDYIEVTYKVLKETGNKDKNYKFYTAFCGLFD